MRPGDSALTSPTGFAQLSPQLSVNFIGIDQLDAAVGDVSNAASDLLSPSLLPARIRRCILQALEQLIRELLALMRREGQQLSP